MISIRTASCSSTRPQPPLPWLGPRDVPRAANAVVRACSRATRKITTVTAGLRASGITVPWLLDGAMNGSAFRTDFASVLVPDLQPGDTVVLDSLPAHKISDIRERIEATGARLLYLPPYSSDFKPTEQAFAKLTALLRTEAARSIPDLWDAIKRALTRFQPTKCRNYLAAAGYHAT
ncbi:hypothetical protein CRT23_26360 [Methylobacterium sp. V23]|nr:hypothetical protein CRT23_26360 [Methylobacterium sp. V23]